MWPCIVEDTPIKDRDVGYLTCDAIADIALQRCHDDGCAGAIVLTIPPCSDERQHNSFFVMIN
jgi:hypothetical protein